MSEIIDLHIRAQFKVERDSVKIDREDGGVIFRTRGDLYLWLGNRPLGTNFGISLDLDEAHKMGEIIDCTLIEDTVVSEYRGAYEHLLWHQPEALW